MKIYLPLKGLERFCLIYKEILGWRMASALAAADIEKYSEISLVSTYITSILWVFFCTIIFLFLSSLFTNSKVYLPKTGLSCFK